MSVGTREYGDGSVAPPAAQTTAAIAQVNCDTDLVTVIVDFASGFGPFSLLWRWHATSVCFTVEAKMSECSRVISV